MKKIFNDEPFTIISHFDLDGCAAPMLFKHCYPKQIKKILYTGYGKLTKTIEKQSCNNLVITDLSLTQDQINVVNFLYEEVILIDHHASSENLKYPDHWKVHIHLKGCATLLAFHFLQHKGFDLSVAKKFAEEVNNYDMWIDPSGTSKYLNNAFWILKPWEFREEFKNFKWKKSLFKRAKEFQISKEQEILAYENYTIDGILRVVVGDKYISDISLFFIEDNHIVFRNKNLISLRSKFNMMPFYDQLLELHIEFGGHKNAGGGFFDGDPVELIELFLNFIKENT